MANGNGGQMAGTHGEEVIERKPGRGPAKKTVKKSPAIRKLSKAAGKKVEEHSTEIAESLYQSTIKGHVQSARLLIDLADGPEDGLDEAQKQRITSLAEKLEKERAWEESNAVTAQQKEADE